MVSAPSSKEAWLTFGLLVSALYTALIVSDPNIGILEGAVLGLFYGGSMAASVAILVLIWRFGKALLIEQNEDSA